MKPVIVLGAGAHATVVFDLLKLLKKEVLGVCDPKFSRHDFYEGVPIIPESELDQQAVKRVDLVNAIGSISDVGLRNKIFIKFKKIGFYFPTLVHPFSCVSQTATCQEGVQIMAGVVVQPKSTIGENSIINTRAVVEHDCLIGRSVHVAPGAVLCGNVSVGEETHIGAGAIIIQNTVIGKRSLIGANATVVKDIVEGHKFVTRHSVSLDKIQG